MTNKSTVWKPIYTINAPVARATTQGEILGKVDISRVLSNRHEKWRFGN